jgi:hypothetical protein
MLWTVKLRMSKATAITNGEVRAFVLSSVTYRDPAGEKTFYFKVQDTMKMMNNIANGVAWSFGRSISDL